MAKRAKTIDLLRVVDLLQEHITPALCRSVFGAVRKTERQRVWTLEALIRFWTAVVLRAPKALSQALVDSLAGRDPTYPRIEASPRGVLSALSRSAARLLCRGLPALHDPPGDGGARALRRRGGAGARPVHRHRDPRRVAPGGHRPSAQAAVERAGRGAARLPVRRLRSGAGALPAVDVLCRCRGQRDDAR